MFTTDDIHARFRSDVDDKLEGTDDAPDSECLWSNEDVDYYMNVAAERTAAKTQSLYGVRTFVITANDPYVRLPQGKRVLDIRSARSLTGKRQLHPFNVSDGGFPVDDYGVVFSSPAWFDTVGTPTHFTLDYQPGRMRLYPTPQIDDTIEIASTLLPTRLSCGMPLPFGEYEDAELMLLWMKAMAYRKHDADAQDLARAYDYEAQFNTRALVRNGEHARRTRAPGCVRMSW